MAGVKSVGQGIVKTGGSGVWRGGENVEDMSFQFRKLNNETSFPSK